MHPNFHPVQIFILLPAAGHKSGGRTRGQYSPAGFYRALHISTQPNTVLHFQKAIHNSSEPRKFLQRPTYFDRALHSSMEPDTFLVMSPEYFYRALHISTEPTTLLLSPLHFYRLVQSRAVRLYLRWISTTGSRRGHQQQATLAREISPPAHLSTPLASRASGIT